MNAEDQMRTKLRMNILEDMKEIRQKAKDIYWYDSAMKQLFCTAGLSSEECARIIAIQNNIDWLINSYETRLLRQESRRDE